VVEAGQLLAARCGLDPEAELADLDGLLVHVHAVEVGLENPAVEIEEGALAAELLQPGVGNSRVQAGAPYVNGAEQAAEIVPHWLWIVWVAGLEGMLQRLGGEQAAAFAEGAEQDPVQQLLGAAQDFGRRDGGVLAAQAGEHALADVGLIRTCWRITSGWNMGLDSTAMGIYDLREPIAKPGSRRRQSAQIGENGADSHPRLPTSASRFPIYESRGWGARGAKAAGAFPRGSKTHRCQQRRGDRHFPARPEEVFHECRRGMQCSLSRSICAWQALPLG
jgi:hypothetical protein